MKCEFVCDVRWALEKMQKWKNAKIYVNNLCKSDPKSCMFTAFFEKLLLLYEILRDKRLFFALYSRKKR